MKKYHSSISHIILSLLFLSLSLLFLSPLVQAHNACIGLEYEGDVLSGVELPTVTITNAPTEVKEGQVISLTAQATVDTQKGGTAVFYWCAEKGYFGEAQATDYNSVEFIAPQVPEGGSSISIGVQVSDGLGYVGHERVTFQVLDTGNTNAHDPAPSASLIMPDTLKSGQPYVISFQISDQDMQGNDSTETLNTDLYYSADNGEFVEIVKGLRGSYNKYLWGPSISVGNYRLKLVITDGNKQTESITELFAVQEKDSNAQYAASGHLFDKSGTPLAHATVQIGDQTATTDDIGHWEIQGLPSGEYTLLASKAGYLFAPKILTLDADHVVVEMDFHEATLNPASCQLYAVDDQGLNNSQFFTVTLNPQQISELGPLHEGYDIEALAIHPQSNFIYAASGNDVTAGHPKGQLYRVDGQTGEVFSVGNTGFEEIGDLAFDAQGTLWAWAKGQGLITLDVTTGAGTLVLPSTLKLAGLTLSKEAGTVFYGAVDQDLWRYDFSNQELDVVCSNLGGKTEAVEMAWGDLLLFGEHQDQTLSLHAFDPKLCQVVAEANVATPQHQDVEGIALPVGACR